ncbi:MAG: M23 family metallopeptidase [Verrucomicrobia subdivision 3 bacterium]|nr:M23 family metallopeptidase [Limisphaerales bacterium]
MDWRALAGLICLALLSAHGEVFRLPTANTALFEPGGQERFFVGTVGKPWTSGTFGCVRTDGWQMHEGLDIRCLQRDKRGEPTDPVMATADGVVAYINRRTGLSNYGNYLILRHTIEGMEVYSLYAHLREVRADLKPGQEVKAGEAVGVMGRTSNTAQAISKERAHVHFELNLLVNDRFAEWYKKFHPGERNDHGDWNGQNLLAIDPQQVLLAERRQGNAFRLGTFLKAQTELCRVMVRDTNFPWLRRYELFITSNMVAEAQSVAGYEIALNFNGLPYELIPRTASETKGKAPVQLLSVNEAEYRKNPCRRLVIKRGNRWELTARGQNLISLLTF